MNIFKRVKPIFLEDLSAALARESDIRSGMGISYDDPLQSFLKKMEDRDTSPTM